MVEPGGTVTWTITIEGNTVEGTSMALTETLPPETSLIGVTTSNSTNLSVGPNGYHRGSATANW